MKFVIANWKMHMDVRGGVAFAKELLRFCRGKEELPEVVLCPGFLAMGEMQKVLSRSRLHLGAQNAFYEDEGAHTGEVSAEALKDAGCRYVIVGHSERRALGETDEVVAKKLAAVLHAGMTPILCVGETESVREHNETDAYVREQLERSLAAVRAHTDVIVAYEPLWAIGTAKTPEPQETAALCGRIRSWAASPKAVLYGGSVDADNAYRFLREDAIDGVLVGGASVKIAQMAEIIQAASKAMHGSTL